MAGVAAAHTLQAAGMHDFLLLEASGRLGGRMRETNFHGLCFDGALSATLLLKLPIRMTSCVSIEQTFLLSIYRGPSISNAIDLY